jgi:hypothetical protein
MIAPAIIAPCGSATVPEIPPRKVLCAFATLLNKNRTIMQAMRRIGKALGNEICCIEDNCADLESSQTRDLSSVFGREGRLVEIDVAPCGGAADH